MTTRLDTTSAQTVHGTASPRPVSLTKKIVAITVGNGLEFFDFAIYTYFATVLGKLFFPAASPFTQLLLSLATFGVGFVVRPLGGIVIGTYADRHGRKAAMTLTLWLMAAGSAVFVVVPTYAQIGMAAPLLLIVGRLVQGFAGRWGHRRRCCLNTPMPTIAVCSRAGSCLVKRSRRCLVRWWVWC